MDMITSCLVQWVKAVLIKNNNNKKKKISKVLPVVWQSQQKYI